jgi:phenylalanyl-tRNA synthetase beta chain
MNISYNWLKNLIDVNFSVEQTAEALTRVGLAVEGIHPHKDDVVLDIDLTSNRPDCLSHLGVARELAAITGKQLRTTHDSPTTLAHEPQSFVKIQDEELCHRFTARIIRNVKIGPSPEWLVDRLEAVGERSINNIADITNYVMLELGQPMHAFDLDKLEECRIVVRTARPGETIKTLDEVYRKLDPTMLAICDAEKPIAAAGIMGGAESAISENTVNVLLEVAYFDRANIRATSRKLNLATEASYRFERGVDIENLLPASARATELIRELAGGQPDEFIDIYPRKREHTEIRSIDIASSVRRLTGLESTIEECDRILKDLGIEPKGQGEYAAPSWRHDLSIEEDLVEEAARHLGYEKIIAALPPAFSAGEYQSTEMRKRQLRQTLVAHGFDEAISYSFIDTRFDDIFDPVSETLDSHKDDKFITLKDSVIEGAVRMRPSTLPGLLEAVRHNFNHQRRDIKLFEVGKVFGANTGESELPTEQEVLSIVLTGGEVNEGRAMAARQLDFYDAKGALEAALSAVGIDSPAFTPAEIRHLAAGQAAEVRYSDRPVGHIGRLADSVAAPYKFRQPVFVAEVNLQALLEDPGSPVRYRPLAKYPSIIRDVSFVVNRRTELEVVRRSIIDQGFELCKRVMFVDIYEGKGLEVDERSITLRLEYRSDERTLIEDEVESVHSAIVEGVRERVGAKIRS